MPLNGHDYGIDPAWRVRVERRLEELKMKRVDLARAAGCSKSLISDLLNGVKDATQFLPEIHMALGWTPPSPPVADQDRDEVIAIFNKLSDKARQRWIGFGQAMAESGDGDDGQTGNKG